jgi:hypothetical protein
MSDKISEKDVAQLAKSVENHDFCALKTKFAQSGADFEDQVRAIQALEGQLRTDRTANASLPDTFITYYDNGTGPQVSVRGWGPTDAPQFNTAYRFDENATIMDCK